VRSLITQQTQYLYSYGNLRFLDLTKTTLNSKTRNSTILRASTCILKIWTWIHLSQECFQELSQKKSFKNKLKKLDELSRIPIGDVKEEVIRAEILDIDMKQSTWAAIDSVPADFDHIIIHVPNITQITHIDRSPHGRFLADVAPCLAHSLYVCQYADCTYPLQDRRHHVLRQLHPFSTFYSYFFFTTTSS